MLSLDIPIFNNYTTGRNMNLAKIRRNDAELRLELEKNSLYTEIENACLDYNRGKDEYTAAAANLEFNKKSFDAVEKKFEAGLVDVTDYSAAKTTLFRAETEALRTRLQLLIRRLSIQFYSTGEYEKIIKQLKYNRPDMDTPIEKMDKAIPKKKGLQKKHIGYIVFGIVIIVLFYMAFFTDRTSTYKVEKDKLIIETVIEDQFNDYITVPGTVEPISIIFLDAQEGGRVEEILIEEGSMVKKGDIILRLSNPDLYLNILDSEAQLAEKENFLRNTQVTMEQERISIKRELISLKYDIERKERIYQQNSVLIKDNLISQEEFIRSKEDLDMALSSRELFIEGQKQDSIFRSVQVETLKANLENMRRNLALVRQRVENLNVRATVDGQLGLLVPEIGQSISRGANMGQINVLTSYKVTAQIDEHYIDRVRTQLTATLDRQGSEFNLVVRRVYPEVRNGTFEIDMVFADSMPDNIRTGQTYYTSLQLGQPKVSVMVPIGGFFQETGGQWIYVLDPSESFATKRNISIGRKNPKYYEVLEGLHPGEKVIVSGYETFGKNEKLIFKNKK